jgi:hypothetical protein
MPPLSARGCSAGDDTEPTRIVTVTGGIVTTDSEPVSIQIIVL